MRGTGLDEGASDYFKKPGLVLLGFFPPFVPEFGGHQISSEESRPENFNIQREKLTELLLRVCS